jgi:hypothetical protein
VSRNVLIQPSYGNAQAKKNWAATLQQVVSFQDGALRKALTDEQYSALIALHPSGEARFWATTENQDKKMDEVNTGDVVLFTGSNHALAVGEVGLSFRNSAAGNALWPPHPTNGPYQNVYSLISFQDTSIPYEDLNKLTAKNGSTARDNYMGARLLRGGDAERVIDGLLISTSTEIDTQPNAFDHWRLGAVVGDEAHNAESSKPSPARPPFIADRRESALVVSYKEFLREAGDTREQGRLKSVVGFSDLYLVPSSGGELELIEAKSDASHAKVREALAQLLDYAAHAHEPLDALTALFPDRPNVRDIEWLANYGIGCVCQAGDTFTTVRPPAQQVVTMKPVWQPAMQKQLTVDLP